MGAIRYIERDILGIATAGVPFAPRPNGIWVDCIECGRRDRLSGEATSRLSDAEAHIRFERRGWTVRPTLCPDHAEGDR